MNLTLEHCCLALKLLCMVILGESYVNFKILADFLACNLFLKTGDKVTAAENKAVVLTLAAFKTLTVNVSVKVKVNLIAHFTNAFFGCCNACRIILHLFNFGVNILVRYIIALFFSRYTLIITEFNLRSYGNKRTEYKVFALFKLNYINLGHFNGVNLCLRHCFIICIGNNKVYSVIVKNGFRIIFLNDFSGRMTLSEPGDINLLHIFLVAFLHCSFKFFAVNFDFEVHSLVLALFNL